MQVRAKKNLGQHFLVDKNIAKKIVDSLNFTHETPKHVLEVGPGTGILTDLILEHKNVEFFAIDVDPESIDFLHKKHPDMREHILWGDFLKQNLSRYASPAKSLSIIGNFPYNISSQILFKILDYKDEVNEMVGMFQKEVAERITAKPATKAYGILSVLMQAYYDVEYLFTVSPGVFNPPPKVKSAVIKATRNRNKTSHYDQKLFAEIIKAAFNQRRKTLRNALKKYIGHEHKEQKIFDLRAERLSVEDFIYLTNLFS